MSVGSLGTVIAVRRYPIEGSSGVVTVTVGKPRKTRGYPDYCCPFRIATPRGTETHRACGLDAIHALLLALVIIGVHLSTLPESKTGRLAWVGGADGDLGLPPLAFVRQRRKTATAPRSQGRRP